MLNPTFPWYIKSMSDNNNDISNSLEQARQEPKDDSPARGFVGISDDGETIQLGEKPQVTKDIKS